MDLLDCACGKSPSTSQVGALHRVYCWDCDAGTPPDMSAATAARAWNAMQQAMRAQDAQPVETMTVHIPVVLYRLTSDGDPRVQVPWSHPSKERARSQIEVIAQGALGHTAQRGDVLAANAHVITAVLPVPQPSRVVEGSAKTVGGGGSNDEDEDTEREDG